MLLGLDWITFIDAILKQHSSVHVCPYVSGHYGSMWNTWSSYWAAALRIPRIMNQCSASIRCRKAVI